MAGHTFHPAEIKAIRIGSYPSIPRVSTDAERIAELRLFNFNATADRFEELLALIPTLRSEDA